MDSPDSFGTDMQDSVMQHDPYTGQHHPWPSHSRQYREVWPDRAWYWNPWTGRMRTQAEVEGDRQGRLILQP